MTYRPNTAALEALEAFAADTSAPAEARATATDWTTRYRAACALVADAAETGARARVELDIAKRAAPGRVVAALAGGKVAAELVGAELPAMRAAVDMAETRYAILERAARDCESRVTGGAFAGLEPVLLPWVAVQRAALPWWEPVPDHVRTAARFARMEFLLPVEACIVADDRPMLRARYRGLALEPVNQPGGLTLFERIYWAWCAIASGEYAMTDQPGGGYTVRITADWYTRAPFPARPVPGKASSPLRRFMGLAG